jgi:Tol biopolymer transport system component
VTLPAGTQLGAYRIATVLGVGGMGEVYRAHDTKLGRDVALKILPQAFRSEPERLARFEREARALAALNHPNIAAIYGVEEQAGVHALVLELVEGTTLAERIAGRPIPIAESLAIARQIVDALEAAHERGIVHRDLKPANIKVTDEGVVKVLDFGLAKAMDPVTAGSGLVADLSRTPTLPAETNTGVILGTAAYMSPEQARGKAVDKRADIWAFGCVLYEMLTGRITFPGETLSDTLVAILDRAPDWSALPSGTPPIVLKLLRRCLDKDARRRVRDIGDARLDLDDAINEPQHAVTRDASRAAHRVQFQRLTDIEGLTESPAISPDGRMVAFVAVVAGKRHIWIRLLAGGAPLQLTRDDVDHVYPRWAPDSSTVIYYTPAAAGAAAGTIWEIGALGGWPRRVAPAISGGDISHDGRRLARVQLEDEHRLVLVVSDRDGSRSERVASLPPGTYRPPRWAPDDRSIALQRAGDARFSGHLDVVDLPNGERREIVSESLVQGFAWLPDGSGFVYSSSRESSLLYPPLFNLRSVLRDGSGDRQLTFGDHSYIEPDVHASGKLVAGRITGRSDIWRFRVGGSPTENTHRAVRVTRQSGHVQVPSASPDDREIVFVSDSGGHANLWIASTDGASARPITFEADPEVTLGVPLWSPRGDLIVFVRIHRTKGALWGIAPDGSNLHELVHGWAPCFSADGRWLYYWRLDVQPGRVERLPLDGGSTEFVREGANTSLPAISPDGNTLFLVEPIRSDVLGFLWGGGVAYTRASPPTAPSETLARVAGERLPARNQSLVMSPDGRHMATLLIDGAATNIWLLPTGGGPMTPMTDFGDRPITIARSVSWSRDSQHIYAAVAETQTDVVLLNGLL